MTQWYVLHGGVMSLGGEVGLGLITHCQTDLFTVPVLRFGLEDFAPLGLLKNNSYLYMYWSITYPRNRDAQVLDAIRAKI